MSDQQTLICGQGYGEWVKTKVFYEERDGKLVEVGSEEIWVPNAKGRGEAPDTNSKGSA